MAEAAAGTGVAGATGGETEVAGTTGTTAAAPWHGITDPDMAAWVETKGWKTTPDVVQSARNAEKLIGRDPSTLLVVPRADDPDGFRAVMSKLGLPVAATDYEFSKLPDGLKADEGYETWARGTFHKLGLPASTVKALTAEHNTYVAAAIAQQQKDYELAVTAEKADLQKEWGGGYERMAAAAKTAATSLGFTGDMIDAMEKAVGYKGTYKFFADLGKKMGEDGFVGTGTKTPAFGNNVTPDEARSQWDAMRLDPVMVAALSDNQHPGHKAAAEKQKRLFGIMYPS